jgi:hypothetical protein
MVYDTPHSPIVSPEAQRVKNKISKLTQTASHPAGMLGCNPGLLDVVHLIGTILPLISEKDYFLPFIKHIPRVNACARYFICISSFQFHNSIK